MLASLTPIYGEAAPKSRTRDLPLMGEGTYHRTKCDLYLRFSEFGLHIEKEIEKITACENAVI
ncbi:hypothetical protein DVH24_005810 [Malus domestica]|uniref:Uncharacterized protein n=1 Tax=Malus domestica TaxID=3750 RepID=A0A498INF4_MALDO|nr:hypothetical protein DVH24_005810 [Malus domestica]